MWTLQVEPQRSLNRAISLPAISFLFSRLCLIWINEAEFTDGYQLLTWNLENPVRWHPLYPFLVKPLSLFLDPIIAGRLVSILSGFGAMIAIFQIAKLLYGERVAALASWLYVVSPLFYWANLRVLTESTFQLFCCWSIYCFLLFLKKERTGVGPAFVAISGLAYLTRPEGILFFPLIALVLWKSRGQSLVSYVVAFVPWVLGFLWSFRGDSSDRYTSIVISGLLEFRWDLALTNLLSYIEVYPYVLFYPVFISALLHIFRFSQDAQWKRTLLYIHLVFAVILFVHPAWTTRLLFIPASVMIVEAAAGFSEWSRRTRNVILATCLLFSLLAIFLQREMFLDFKQTALVAKESKDRRVVSDELAKTEYYLRRSVVVYEKTALEPGDIVILHSYNTDLEDEKTFLDGHYRYKGLYSSHADVVPLLANAALSEIHFTNSPAALIQRFQTHRFQSVVIQIEGRK